MRLMGHETRSIFDRYAIMDEDLLREQAAKLSDFFDQAKIERKVLPLDR